MPAPSVNFRGIRDHNHLDLGDICRLTLTEEWPTPYILCGETALVVYGLRETVKHITVFQPENIVRNTLPYNHLTIGDNGKLHYKHVFVLDQDFWYEIIPISFRNESLGVTLTVESPQSLLKRLLLSDEDRQTLEELNV